jgi:hypothetical protein
MLSENMNETLIRRSLCFLCKKKKNIVIPNMNDLNLLRQKLHTLKRQKLQNDKLLLV